MTIIYTIENGKDQLEKSFKEEAVVSQQFHNDGYFKKARDCKVFGNSSLTKDKKVD